MKQIVRVEHPLSGRGMFTNRGAAAIGYMWDSSNKFRPLLRRHESFNTPFEDNLEFTIDHHCGYRSIDHFQKWVTKEEIGWLIEMGYVIYLISLSDYQEGIDNVIFLKKDILSKENINQLFI